MQPILLPTAYFPPVSWMAAALQSEYIAVEIHETYPKQTYRNRCEIATSSGILSLTVPVKRVNGNHTKTCDIRIDNTGNWQLPHWRSIITAYNKSPYFIYYRDLFEPVFFKKQEFLIDLNAELLTKVLDALRIKTITIVLTKEYEEYPDSTDLRDKFHPGNKPGQSIPAEFPRYMQTFEEKHGFISDLSILDLLLNCGPEASAYLEKVRLRDKE